MTGNGKPNPLMAHHLVRAMVQDGGVVTLTQLKRRGLSRGAAGLPARLLDEGTDRSRHLVPVLYFASDLKTIKQPQWVLRHLALFFEAGRLLGIDRGDWQVVKPGSDAQTADGVWARGPVGAGLDYAAEIDTGYPWDKVLSKIKTAGPPGFHISLTEPEATRLGYLGLIWSTDSRVRADRLRRKLMAWLDFEQLQPSTSQRAAGVKVYQWTGKGRTFTVWTLIAKL